MRGDGRVVSLQHQQLLQGDVTRRGGGVEGLQQHCSCTDARQWKETAQAALDGVGWLGREVTYFENGVTRRDRAGVAFDDAAIVGARASTTDLLYFA